MNSSSDKFAETPPCHSTGQRTTLKGGNYKISGIKAIKKISGQDLPTPQLLTIL